MTYEDSLSSTQPDFSELCEDIQFLLEGDQPSGIMVALYVPKDVAEKIAVPDGETAEDLHVTLAYLPGIGKNEEKMDKMVQALRPVAEKFKQGVEGKVGGIGRFNPSENSDGKQVYYASFDAPGLTELVELVQRALREDGFDVATDHGFTPHITLKYLDSGEELPQDVKESEAFYVPELSVASRALGRKDLRFGGDAS